MKIEIDHRAAITLMGLLRRRADEDRRMHGKMVDRHKGIVLTPFEMEALAETIDHEAKRVLKIKKVVVVKRVLRSKRK